jgi:hypothetical protein
MAVHATELEAAKAALQEGADILVHSVMDLEVDEAFLDLARARRAIYIPTLIVSDDYTRTGTQRFDFTREELAWGDPFQTGTLFDLRHLPRERIPERLQRLLASPDALKPTPVLAENLRRVARAGIPVAMGTDAGNIGTLHGPSVFRELRAMEEAGLTPLEVLRAATVGGAAVMGHAADLGRVAPGFLADLLLLDADPALSTANLSRLHRVIRGGVPLEPAALAADGPEALAQRQLNAFNAHDLEAFAAVYDPEVELLDLSGKVLERGTAALQARYRRRFEASPGLHCELVKRMAVGDWVVDEERITGGGPQAVHALAVYEVKGGKIARVRLLR